jgi:hypothetical protein
MRVFYALAFLSVLLLSPGCSKDILKSYDKRVLGTWEIIDIDRFGFNEPDALPFKETDLFTFDTDGALTIERAGSTYHGSWDIQRIKNGDDEETKALHITAIDFNNQQVRAEFFNDMRFTNTNRFTAFINYNTRTYVYRFLRQ